MDNNEKKEYLNLQIALQSPAFICELANKDKYLNSIPKVLYKYRKFDEFTFDMIENSYVYLAPAGKLDDPFDCLTATDSNKIYDNKKLTIKNEMIDYIFDIVNNHPHSGEKSEDELKDITKRTIVNGKLDSNLVKKEMQNTFNYSDEQVNFILSILEGIDNMIPNITDDKKFKVFLKKLVLSKEKVGVCSFTTNKDNKPMWSLYADVYKGYCIEYVTPKRKNVVNNLCPVIYSKEFENNIFKTLIEFAIETMIRYMSEGKMKTNMGCFTQLLCTKDSDWSSQDEWRLIGKAKKKCKPFKIKSVYLGFDVSIENQNNMLEIAKNKHFKVYKMNRPNGSKFITYKKLN